ncbi:MAG TPA: hypothetical protein VIB79_06785 [Candidatus Binatia bacterium]
MKRASQTSPGADPYTATSFAADVKTAREIAIYFKKPLPATVFDALKEITRHRQKSLVEAVAEDVADVSYLRGLHSLGLSVYYGLGLPSQTLIFLDRKRAFSFAETGAGNHHPARSVKNAEDLYLSLLWHRFGLAVLISGVANERNSEKNLFSLKTTETREEWFRLKDSQSLPVRGARVEIFGWQKWNSRIVEVLEIRQLA